MSAGTTPTTATTTPTGATTTATTAPPAGLLGAPLRALTVGSVALVSLAAFEAMAVTTAMPTVAAALDGLSGYALAFGLPLAASVVGMVLAGPWSDARGPAASMRLGVAAFALGLLIAGLAPSMAVLSIGRTVQGLGSGLFSVALYVVVGRVVAPALRPRLFAAFAAAWVLPAVIGPPLAGAVVEGVGWRWVFVLAAIPAVPAAILVEPALRGLGRPVVARPRSRLRSRLGAAWTPLTRPGLLAVISLRGLAAAAFFAAEAFVPLVLSRERGLTPTAAGLVLTVAALTWSVGSWVQGRDRAPSRRVLLRAGTASLAVGVLAAGATVLPAVPVAVGVLGWAAAGLGMGLTYPTLSVLTLELAPPAEQGAASSALQVADALFAAVALAVSGALFAALVDTGTVAHLAAIGVAAVPALAGVLLAGAAATGRPSSTRLR